MSTARDGHRPSAPEPGFDERSRPVSELAKGTAPRVLAAGDVLAGRYQLLDQIGSGGLAVVHRALDTSNGRYLALKSLKGERSKGTSLELFEREFHVLSQLAHPRVVEVYDYNACGDGAFYTMELLDGGDLHSAAPVEHGQACAWMRDVCSALSLIHSRRLVHRDVGSRNVRCTSDGSAKLIDFGAMIPMGLSRQIIGTAPYCAPEAIERQRLDGRTDLYSVGATLYFTLSGRHAYPAPDFRQLRELWNSPPPPPSQFVPGIPATLDDLVMELLELDPRKRPESAAEVMDRLSAIAGIPPEEQLVVSQAYLTTPTLVGRDDALSRIRTQLERGRDGVGSSVLVEGNTGLGRTRFLEECALEAKRFGNTVVCANRADALDGDYGAVRALARLLVDAHPRLALDHAAAHASLLGHLLPELIDGDDHELTHPDDRHELRLQRQQALRQWFLDVSHHRPLVLVVDDVDRLDEPSTAFLALLANEAPRHRIVIVAATSSRTKSDETAEDLKLLANLSSSIKLRRLSREQTLELLSTVFGEVSHLQLLADRIHDVSRGNPRDIMQLAQHLVDRGTARYQAGSWTLPRRIDTADLPDTLARALRDRADALSPDARELAQACALTPQDSWAFEQCLLLTSADRVRLRIALDELVSAGVLSTTGERYCLSQHGWITALLARVDRTRTQVLHERIARAFAALGSDFRVGQHLMAAGQTERALDLLVEHARTSRESTTGDQQAYARMLRSLPLDFHETYQKALVLCAEHNRPLADRYALNWRRTSLLEAKGHDGWHAIFEVMQQCRHDVGLDLYDELAEVEPDHATRLPRALGAAQQRYEQLPAEEAVLSPKEAFQPLVESLVEGIGVASRLYDRRRWHALTSLEPLTELAPSIKLVDFVRQAVGERLAGRYVRAIEDYGTALQRLEVPDRAGLKDSYYAGTRDGLLCARALIDAAMGSSRVLEAVSVLEQGPFLSLSAIQLRMLYHLWQGDGEEADRLRKRFELAQVQSNVAAPYEGGLLFTELCAVALSDDISRLRRIMHTLESWAKRFPSWLPMLHYARATQYRIGGNFPQALRAVREGLSVAEPGEHQLWPLLAGAEVRCLLGVGQDVEALEVARCHRATADEHRIDYLSAFIRMPMCLALARVGEVAQAQNLATEIVEGMQSLGVGGVPLGLAYLVLASVCIDAEDSDGFEAAAGRCATLFEHSTNRALNKKHQRLLRKARKARLGGKDVVASLIEPSWESSTMVTQLASVFDACNEPEQRAQVAAKLLADHCGSDEVFVYVPAPDGARLVATVGSHSPSPRLDELAREYLSAGTGALDDETAATEAVGSALECTSAFWEGASNKRYYPIVLAHCEHAKFMVSGVAVVALSASTSFVQPARLAAELSRLGLGMDP